MLRLATVAVSVAYIVMVFGILTVNSPYPLVSAPLFGIGVILTGVYCVREGLRFRRDLVRLLRSESPKLAEGVIMHTKLEILRLAIIAWNALHTGVNDLDVLRKLGNDVVAAADAYAQAQTLSSEPMPYIEPPAKLGTSCWD